MPRFYLPYQSTLSKTIGAIWLAFFLLFYGLVLFSETGSSWSFYARAYASLAGLSLLFAGFLWSRKILQAATWFHATSTPHRLWRAWLRGLMLRAWLYWIAYALSMNLLEATHQALSHWSAVWAYSALALSGAFLLNLFTTGHAPRVLTFCLMGGLIFLGIESDIGAFTYWASQLWYTHLPFVLAWMSISFALIFLWTSPPAPPSSTALFPAIANSQLLLRLNNQFRFYRRYSSLDGQSKRQLESRSIQYSNRLLHFTALFWFSGTIPALSVDWGGKISLSHLLFLGVSSAILSTYLVGKDLHWRFLLIPNGLRQGSIGSHLLLSTLSYYAKFLLIIVSLAIVLHVGITGRLPAATDWISSKTTLFFAELIMCLCIAIAVRGCQHPRRVFFYLFNLSLLASALYALFAFFQHKNALTATITTMNLPFLVSIISLALVALIYANKQWTTARLIPYLKSSS